MQVKVANVKRFIGVALLFVTLAGAIHGCGSRSTQLVSREIESDIQSRDMPEDAPWRDRRTQSLVRAFYTERRMLPAWTSGKGALNQARDLAGVLARAEEEGLNPEDYSAVELAEHLEENKSKLLAKGDPKALAEFDLLCTIAAFHYMSDVYDGRISPKALDAEWVAKPRRGDFDSLLTDALRQNRIREMLTELPPSQPQYRKLREARAKYAEQTVQNAEAGGAGDSSSYQLRQIELNMERWRWVPRSFGDRYLLVNIPEYELNVIERGKTVLEMRVVVGKTMTATPVFSDVMTQVVVNPNWNVPESIVQGEFSAAVEEDRDYLAKNKIRIFEGDAEDAKEVDAKSVNWRDSAEVAKLRFRQDSGEGNALGRIKFLLPNQFNVYLHDTPSGHLFSREERSFSHGCVRVENPTALARYVLDGLPEAREGEIEKLIATGETTTLDLPKPLPVHILYFTAFVEDNGDVRFHEDVYGIDRDLIGELKSRSREQARQQAAL
jgi:murein L,D-transpeptidase YcbB/YkuD